jgi:Protein of unknown function (DUF3558)
MFGRLGRRTAISFVGVTLLVGACTASVGPTAPAQSGQASASPTSGVPVGPITSPAPSSSPAPSGGSPGPAVSPGDIDPCTLLTAADLVRVNGGTYPAGVSHTASKGRLCVWQNQSPGESVTVELVPNGPGLYAALKGSLQGFSETTITTVADAAFIARHASAPSTGGIYVQDGSTIFTIVYLDGTVPSDAQLVGVALEVVAKLP